MWKTLPLKELSRFAGKCPDCSWFGGEMGGQSLVATLQGYSRVFVYSMQF